MTVSPNANQIMLNITAVERDTRIGKDALRVWERRYGFPQPVRDANGERLYPADQVEKLRVIKRLLDAGHRPGRIVALELGELHRMGEELRDSDVPMSTGAKASAHQTTETRDIIDLLKTHDPAQIRRRFSQTIMRTGLAPFVLNVALPLMHEIGEAWASGELHIFEEHLCSEVLETSLRSAMAAAPEAAAGSRPRVLLSTFPGESHSLGLLMAEVMFQVDGCACMSLGAQTPLQDLVNASRAHRADIVAVSFSAASNPGQAAEGLGELRSLLDPDIELWAGSPHTLLHRRGVPDVTLLASLEQIPMEIQRWRACH
ncbi:MerR family transcriptional regulator [Neopusillimonas aromaticivorans]|uniref:MerR family transcriptional regulator n=1 Tax=Neopusillimonas aromaticivorans TaxID=2979868 RepID=UPI00259A7154|nr:MerR family transcriptional regulator [Neopusillimonas aromaticivorans]WJJ94551.1 MerR family transcriptional regulator [Neopusillimonas aromaticivorans]